MIRALSANVEVGVLSSSVLDQEIAESDAPADAADKHRDRREPAEPGYLVCFSE